MLRFSSFAVLIVALVCFATVAAEQGEKEVTLKGKITCAKCDLQKEKGCATVIVTKEKDKEVIYFFDKKGHGKYHSDTCTEAKDGSVTGVTSKDGEKLIITVSKVEYK